MPVSGYRHIPYGTESTLTMCINLHNAGSIVLTGVLHHTLEFAFSPLPVQQRELQIYPPSLHTSVHLGTNFVQLSIYGMELLMFLHVTAQICTL